MLFMVSTGITRPLDPLGRIVLPIELRRTFGITQDDGLEIFGDEDRIAFRKYTPGCLFCGESEDDRLIPFHGKMICDQCRVELSDLVVDKH